MLCDWSLMELGSYLKAAREKAGLSQLDVGKHLGISKPAVSKWETGNGAPDWKRIAELARILLVPHDELREIIERYKRRREMPKSNPAPPDTFVQMVDRTPPLTQTAETKRDVPQLGINPRSAGVGDFEMGKTAVAYVRRPVSLLGREDVRALRTKSGDLLFLESEKVHPPRKGDQVAVVLKSDGVWAPTYLRRLNTISDTEIALEGDGSREAITIQTDEIFAVYRIMTLADLFG